MSKGKNFVAFFLIFSLLTLSANLYAKEGKGADLIIQKTDGQQVRGELIAVKENSLLLLERESGADVSADIGDISKITIVKKSKAWTGFIIGSLIGSGIAGGYGISVADYMENNVTLRIIAFALLMGLATGGLAALIAGLSSFDKTIQIEDKSDSETQEILEELRKKTRIKNYQ